MASKRSDERAAKINPKVPLLKLKISSSVLLVNLYLELNYSHFDLFTRQAEKLVWSKTLDYRISNPLR